MGGVGTDYGMPMRFYMGTRASYGSCWNNVMVATTFADSYEWKDGRQFSWKEFFKDDPVAKDYETNDATKKKVFNSTIKNSKVVVYTPYNEQPCRYSYQLPAYTLRRRVADDGRVQVGIEQ